MSTIIRWSLITIIVLGLLGAAPRLYAETYLSDHFELDSDTVLTSYSQLASAVTGSWGFLMRAQETTVEISTSAGHTGRGISFYWGDRPELGVGAQEGCIGVNEGSLMVQYPTSCFIGFWFRKDHPGGGPTSNQYLKMLRWYTGSNSHIPDIIMNTGDVVQMVYDQAEGHDVMTTVWTVDDELWHYYIIELRGASTSTGADGIYRVWVDGYDDAHRVYNRTDLHWNSSANNIIDFRIMSGNLSEGYHEDGGENFSTYWDDFIVASSLAEVTAFLGTGGDPDQDTTPPTVTITTQGQTVTADSIVVEFTDSDDTGVTSRKWRIGSAPDATHGTECTSPATISGLSVGSNTIYIGAVDAAGNWGSDSITVNYSPVAATISIINSGIRGGGGVR